MTENTMHLLFECEKFCKPLWCLFDIVNKETIRPEGNELNIRNPRMNTFVVMYNIGTGVPNKYIKPIMVIIQEIRHNMI